jgi:hypothetical protein
VEQVLKEDNRKCRQCGDISHLDVYTIDPDDYKDKLENLETLCKDCHDIKKQFHGSFDLVNSFISVFQHLTGMSGRRYFQYRTGRLDTEKYDEDVASSYDNYIKEMNQNPYSRLKRSSSEELVSKTRKNREQLIQNMFLGDYQVYITSEVLNELLPILKDYSEMINNEAEARRRKDKLSKP